ncbi:MAG: glycosyltransferase family 2 protein [Gammaproteobacteria bacterium]|nr:glycosyltransferase family 2 protein [Gammaproteobacteria bacterium]
MTPELHTLPDAEQSEAIQLWHDALWRGLSEQAVAALLQLRLSNVDNIRRRANWVLGRWYASQGHYQLALDFFYEVIRIERFPQGKVLVAIAICEQALGRPQVIRSLLTNYRFTALPTHELMMLDANSMAQQPDMSMRRLRLINRLMQQQQLDELTLIDPGAGLTLFNLTTANSNDWPQGRALRNDANLPLISVIVPTFNAAATIQPVLGCLVRQTWPNLEIIVVDDASTDDTVAEVRALAEHHPCIRLLAQDVNRGAYASRNIGMRAASGDWLTVNDSDDWSHPEKIARQAEPLLADRTLQATLSAWVRVSETLEFLGLWMVGGRFVEKNHSSAMIRKEVLRQIGYWDEVRVSADSEFLWRLQTHFGEAAVHLIDAELPLSFSLVHEQSLTQVGATHVRSIYFGVRRLYREASDWWHRQGNPVLQENSRPFPLPIGMTTNQTVAADIVFVIDATANNSKLKAQLQRLKTKFIAQGRRVLLLHWPKTPAAALQPVSDEVFAFMQLHGLSFAHYGVAIEQADVVFADWQLLELIPDQLPTVTDLQACYALDSAVHGDDEVMLSARLLFMPHEFYGSQQEELLQG